MALLPTPVITTDGKSHCAGDLRRKSPGLRSVSDLLPTPSAGNFNASESPEQWEARRQRVQESAANGNGMGMPLGIAVQLLPTPTAADANSSGGSTPADVTLTDAVVRTDLGRADNPRHLLPTPRATRGGSSTESVQLLPTPSVADSTGGHERRGGTRGDELLLKGIATQQAWGPYRAAIARWEALTRPAPAPTVPGRNGRPRLNPEFSEWMMGWPAGWVTDVPGMRDPWKHHAIGNGVVPQQAAAAIRWCLNQLERMP